MAVEYHDVTSERCVLCSTMHVFSIVRPFKKCSKCDREICLKHFTSFKKRSCDDCVEPGYVRAVCCGRLYLQEDESVSFYNNCRCGGIYCAMCYKNCHNCRSRLCMDCMAGIYCISCSIKNALVLGDS